MRPTTIWLLVALIPLWACKADPAGDAADSSGQDVADATGGDAAVDGAPVDLFFDSDAADNDSAGDPPDEPDAVSCTVTSTELDWDDCTDEEDNDCDGLVDQLDPGCTVCVPDDHPLFGIENSDGECGDGWDNDCNGETDCADRNCRDRPTCPAEDTDELCSDGLDNDGDNRTDCLQPSCASLSLTVCRPAEDDQVEPGEESTVALCSNRLDDDRNGQVDCADSSCNGIGYCTTEATDVIVQGGSSCEDYQDNDGNGLIDCWDGSCQLTPSCPPEDHFEVCEDDIDNDFDGLLDCRDPDCYTNDEEAPACR